jgi:hypothetical protein
MVENLGGFFENGFQGRKFNRPEIAWRNQRRGGSGFEKSDI